MAETQYKIRSNIDRADIQPLKNRLGAALANYTVNRILELPENMQRPVYYELLERLARKRE